MPSVTDIVQTITIRGVADGIDATRAATTELKDAFDAAATAAKSSTADISGAFDAVQRSVGAAGAGGGSGGLSFLSSIGLGAAASVAGIGVFLTWVQKTNKDLADMNTAAARASLSLHDFQTLQFSAGTQGVSSDTFASGAAKMATNLEEASRKENDLSKLLDANNVKFKDGNKLILDQNAMWDVARDLISRAANEQQKIKMADMIGLSKEWVPLLSEGAAAFTAARNEADKLGLVIDDGVIARAKTFDDEWRKSSLVFSTWMKAQIADLIPTVDDLIVKAQGITQYISTAVQAGVNRLPSDTGQTSNEARAAAVMALIKDNDTLAERTDAAILAFKALTGTLDENTKALIDNNISGISNAKMWDDIAKGMEGAWAASKRLVTVPMPPTRPTSNLPPETSNDGSRDFWDRATDAIAKHTSQLNADSLSVGQSIQVREQLRGEFAMLEAARMAEKGVTDEQIAQYTTLRASMGAEMALKAAHIKLNNDDAESFIKLTEAAKKAAEANALATVNSNITFGQRTAFLSQADVSIATQLKTLYGNEVPDALASSYAATIRFNDAMHTLSGTIENSIVTGLDSIVMHTSSAGDAFRKMGSAVVSALDQMILKIMVVEPMMRQMQSVMGGSNLLGLLGLLGPSGNLAATNSLATGASAADLAFAFSSGGIVGSGGKPTYVHSAYFDHAPHFAGGGMITDGGVPIIAHPGERILNRQETAAYNSGGSAPITINTVNNFPTNADPQFRAEMKAYVDQSSKQAVTTAVQTVVRARSNNQISLQGR
jgi:hypothetical protein